MNQEEFLDLIRRFAARPLPAPAGRHVYLWHGETSSLMRAVPGHAARTLDLNVLAAGLPEAPMSTDGARRVLLRAIRDKVGDLVFSEQQQVLIVTGCDLLSRYRVPLGSFFEVSSERTAVVLVVPPVETRFRPAEPLPEYVSLTPHAHLDYLRAALGEGAIIATV